MHAGRFASVLTISTFFVFAGSPHGKPSPRRRAEHPHTRGTRRWLDPVVRRRAKRPSDGVPPRRVNWKVTDGTIVATEGENGLLYTTSQFGNYQLKVDFRSAKGANSGVFLRTPPIPTDVENRCYELNIADTGTNPFPTGSFVKRKKARGRAR